MILSLLPFGRRAVDEGLGAAPIFLLVFSGRRVTFKDRKEQSATTILKRKRNESPLQ
jgi:hypothetical protein